MHLRFLGSAAVMTMLLLPGASAHVESGAYTIGTTPVVSVVCSPNCLGTPLNFGGYTFPADPEQAVRVDIVDASAGPVSFTVCQDLNGQLCGEAGEPNIVACGNAALLSGSAVAFRPNLPISVFVRLIDPGCVGGLALGGTITVTYTP